MMKKIFITIMKKIIMKAHDMTITETMAAAFNQYMETEEKKQHSNDSPGNELFVERRQKWWQEKISEAGY